MGLEMFYKVMWVTLHGISLLMGGMSLVMLYASFSIPEFGALAFAMLLGASIIALGLPPLEHQPSAKRPSLARIRRWPSIIRRLSDLARRL